MHTEYTDRITMKKSMCSKDGRHGTRSAALGGRDSSGQGPDASRMYSSPIISTAINNVETDVVGPESELKGQHIHREKAVTLNLGLFS